MDRKMPEPIKHIDELPGYVPPGHSGSHNIRLIERDVCEHFEMVLGEMAPGGVAEPHYHEREFQAMYVLEGTADFRVGDDPPRACGPGTIVRIPPGVVHELAVTGDVPLKLMIVYAPPLAAPPVPARKD